MYVWPRKSRGDPGGLPGSNSITLGLEGPPKAKTQRWEGRAGTGLRRAAWWGSPQKKGLVERAEGICMTLSQLTSHCHSSGSSFPTVE